MQTHARAIAKHLAVDNLGVSRPFRVHSVHPGQHMVKRCLMVLGHLYARHELLGRRIAECTLSLAGPAS
eukprot:4252626-Alexandrium_andersonii.AAC.1